jgi:hypothetical protein
LSLKHALAYNIAPLIIAVRNYTVQAWGQ